MFSFAISRGPVYTAISIFKVVFSTLQSSSYCQLASSCLLRGYEGRNKFLLQWQLCSIPRLSVYLRMRMSPSKKYFVSAFEPGYLHVYPVLRLHL